MYKYFISFIFILLLLIPVTQAHTEWESIDHGVGLNTIHWGEGVTTWVAGQRSSPTDDPIRYSLDGENWTIVTTGDGGQPRGLAYSDSLERFVMVLDGSDTTANRAYSDLGDATSWTTITGNLRWNYIHRDEDRGLFAALRDTSGSTAWILTSSDGISWGSFPVNDPITPHSMDCNPTICVVVGSGSPDRLMTSTDPNLESWNGRGAPLEGRVGDSVVWIPTENQFVAIGAGTSSKFYTSPDGINWSPGPSLSSEQAFEIRFFSETEVTLAVGPNGVYKWEDGIISKMHSTIDLVDSGSGSSYLDYSPSLGFYLTVDTNDNIGLRSFEESISEINITDAPTEVNSKLTFSVSALVTRSGEPLSNHTVGLTISPHIATIGTTNINGEVTFSNLQISVPGSYTILVTNEDGKTDSQSLTIVTETLPGHVSSGDNFLGVLPMDPVADGFETDVRTIGWFFGIFLVLLLIGVMAAAWGAVGIVLGAIIGVIISFATGLFPIWLLFLIIMAVMIIARLLFGLLLGGSSE